MRLTLRTMLAYLDDVLDAGDASILGEKIKESEFASNLVSRIRASISQQRLGSPPVDGKGIGTDANSVAEYLDSTLPPDRVPDFERVCLESDGHLAEVAACHQVLTLVLGKPAAVPAHLRERAYRFGSTLENGGSYSHSSSTTDSEQPHRPAHAHNVPSAQAGVDIASQDTSPTTSDDPVHATESQPNESQPAAEREKVEVPEYLREGRRRSRVAALAVSACVLLVLAGIGYLVASQFFPNNDLAQVDPNQNTSAPAKPPEQEEESTTPATEPDESEDTESSNTGSETESNAEATDQSPSQPATEGTTRAETPPAQPAENSSPAETPTTPVDPQPADNAARVPDTIEVPGVPTPPPIPTPPPSETPPSETPPSETPRTEPVVPSDSSAATPAVTDNGTPMPVEPGAGSPTDTPPAEPAPEKVSPVDVGRFLTGDKVLARLNDKGQWLRLPTNTPIRSGNQVLALPAYRPQIALTSGVNLTLDGPTRLEFLRPGEEDHPQIDLKYGKLLAITVAKEGSPMGLTIGKLQGTVRLSDTDTMLAIEAVPFRAPGIDPQQNPTQLDIRLICLTGRIDWIAEQGNAVAIAAGEQFVVQSGALGQITKFDAPPAWTDDKATSLPDRDAARTLEQSLEANRSVALSLTEVVNGPRADLRSLAVRSLSYLDNHSAFIAALNDPSQRSAWAAEVDAVKHALARSPQSAAQVQKALEKERGATSKQLYRLLWGYSQEDLIAGADATLVGYLDHDSQEFRVLAIENLRRITGATHLYRPEYNPQRRKPYVQTWRKDLEEGEIRYPEETVPGA